MSKRPDTWMPFYVGDYIADTMHLNLAQHGGYFLLILAYWRNNGPLADDDQALATITKSTPEEWTALRPLLSGFFKIRGGFWHQKRIDFELKKSRKISRERRKAGLKSAATRWEHKRKSKITNGITNPQQNDTPSQSHIYTGTSVPDGDSPSVIPFDPVKDMWSRGLAILGERHRSLLGKFVKAYGKVAVLAAIIECENEQPVDPAAYFIACLERGKANARTGSAESAAAKLAAWARAEDEPESVRGYSEAAH